MALIALLTVREETVIWVADAEGQTTYLCAEWYAFTGLKPSTGLGFGWTSVVHPDERDLMEETFRQACATRCEFALQYRLRRRDGAYVWVTDSAAPSWLPGQKAFLGFLGQISGVEPDRQGLIARAELHAFEAVTPVGEFAAVTIVDAVADHVLMARALAVASGAQHLLPAIDDLLMLVGRDLAQQEVSGETGAHIH